MTTPRPIPHGTYKGNRLYGCKEPCCMVAARRYLKSVRLAKIQGTWQPWGNTDQAREHLHLLLSRGWTLSAVADHIGHDRSVLEAIMTQPDRRVRHHIVDAIRAVGLDELPPLVPVYRMSRRLRALAAQGWSSASVAQEVDVGSHALDYIRAERGLTVHRPQVQAFLPVYQELRDRPCPSPNAERVRRRARSLGWLTDVEWGGLIDVPPNELAPELARQVALLDGDDLAEAHRARRRGERSLLIVAAAREHGRRKA